MKDEVAMANAIDALAPWLNQLVLIGGWAHRLHRHHPHASVPTYRALATRDVDVGVDPKRELHGRIDVALADARFDRDLSGEHRPPISRFHHREDRAFYLEFLSPLRGSGRRRDGSEDATIEIAGATAQKLRHLDVLFVDPWQLDLEPSAYLPLSKSARAQVANPVSFVVQKLLIHESRLDDKRAQDLLYIHDTIELFGAQLASLNRLWLEEVKPTLTRKELATVNRQSVDLFKSVTDTIREAVLIPADRSLGAEELRVRCSVGLRELLAPE